MSNPDINLFRDEEFEEVKLTPEKVVCLGMEFESDEARRAYFREELRKKLPELRQIEGFPIGEDEDIINLSDPPYYTACPNPWLNDFVAEWEQEKVELERQGKRSAKFEVNEPYASDVSEGKNNPIYMAHSYHTKVPHPAIMRYIAHYTQPGDIIFDGFAGTGMTGVASNLCSNTNQYSQTLQKSSIGKRHCICTDLSPIATLISNSYNTPFDSTNFRKKANRILKEVEQKWGWMYNTCIDGCDAKINFVVWSDDFVCPTCGREVSFWDVAVDMENDIIHEIFNCPHCSSLLTKKDLQKAWVRKFDSLSNSIYEQRKKSPVLINYTYNGKRKEGILSDSDIKLLQDIDNIDISHLKTSLLPIGEKTNGIIRANNVQRIHELYTKRNYIYLSEIFSMVKDDPFLVTWVTSILQTASTMYSFRLNRKNGIMKGTLYIPSLVTECNPYHLLKSKIDSFINAHYDGRGNSVVGVSSATCIGLSNASVDYIFIDPPFGSNLMYSELNSIWEGWIRLTTNNQKEAIINSTQQKSLFNYQSLMNESFLEFYRILKPGKWATIEFSNTSASVWNSIQNSLQGVGFVIVNVAAIDKKQGSYNAITSTTAVKQDLVITCYKPTDELINKFDQSTDKSINAMDFIEELLYHLPVHLEKNNSTTAVIERSPKILYDRLISYYVQHGYAIPMDAQEFQKALRERFIERDGMFFTASQTVEYEAKKEKTDGVVPMALFISSEAEGIEWLKRELTEPQTYQEILPNWMKDMVAPKKGDVLPELAVILEENFIKDEDGKWRKPDAEKAADLEILRGKKLMKEFNLYLEQASKPKAKRIKDTRLEVLRYGFKECYKQKNYQAIVTVGDHIQESLLQEDEVLLQYYDIASMKV